jgi:hypothetical protein
VSAIVGIRVEDSKYTRLEQQSIKTPQFCIDPCEKKRQGESLTEDRLGETGARERARGYDIAMAVAFACGTNTNRTTKTTSSEYK